MLGALIVLAGCSTDIPTPPSASSVPTSPRLPSRPAALPLAGVNPCMLLTAPQRGPLGIDAGHADSGANDTGPFHGPTCTWLAVSPPPDDNYSATAILDHGVELGTQPTRSVAGYTATTTTSTGTDPNFFCGFLIDVADGQSLNVTYSNISQDDPPMNRQLACTKAQRLAEDLITTLRYQQGK